MPRVCPEPGSAGVSGGQPGPRRGAGQCLISRNDAGPQAAQALSLSRATVKSHLAHVDNRLGVQSRTAALSVARHRGIV
ncbi:LuxR C-terminal-related transcriptional regulator [Pseudonocardia nantongensis]|uniref:LuxR C-terminal-related transcriptional regulator n=1 Tax=Pseudonocardia nantongensis TaxID=1181885 RepID=UPI003978A16F